MHILSCRQLKKVSNEIAPKYWSGEGPTLDHAAELRGLVCPGHRGAGLKSSPLFTTLSLLSGQGSFHSQEGLTKVLWRLAGSRSKPHHLSLLSPFLLLSTVNHFPIPWWFSCVKLVWNAVEDFPKDYTHGSPFHPTHSFTPAENLIDYWTNFFFHPEGTVVLMLINYPRFGCKIPEFPSFGLPTGFQS